ncbi:hypothetical protein [Pseudotabrizicola alkalilacus]|uniref:hypothetical protein n=1 Tax=Pseudotabrizicola alkalilacus TaxID=2305252 RepID=UPI0011C1778F|nr:hypothetical protein [Pseudotabrizicola alkalilacus]
MSRPVTPARRRCTICHGWGYIPCECWPGDCICGFGDEDCEYCEDGWIYDDEDDDVDWQSLLFGTGQHQPNLKGLITSNRRAPWEDDPAPPSRQVRRQAERLAKKGRRP